MMGAIKLLLGSGGTDVAELPFFIGSTYTAAYAPYNIRKLGTGTYGYKTDNQFAPPGNIANYEKSMTVWWSPDGVMPVQSTFFDKIGASDMISNFRTMGDYTFSLMYEPVTTHPVSTGNSVPTDRFLYEGFPAADQLGSSGISTDPAATYTVPEYQDGAGSVVSSKGSSGYNVNIMLEADANMIDLDRFNIDMSNGSFRIQNFYDTGNGEQFSYVSRLNGAGTVLWAKEFGTSGTEPSNIKKFIPLSDGKSLLLTKNGDGQMLVNSDGSVAYQQTNSGFANTYDWAIDTSETYAYAVKMSTGELFRMTISNGNMHSMSIRAATGAPSRSYAGGTSYGSLTAGFDNDGYLWMVNQQYGVSRVNLSSSTTPVILGTYQTTSPTGGKYCTPHTALVDGDRLVIFTSYYDNSTYDGYAGFLYCLKTDFSTTTVDNQLNKAYNNRYGITAQQGDGGFGDVTAYTTSTNGSWNSESTSSTTLFSVTDRASYDWATNYANYKLGVAQQGDSRPQNSPIS